MTKAEREIWERCDADFRSSVDHPTTREYQQWAITCYEYVEGEQWTAEERRTLARRKQPDTVNNLFRVTLDRLVGQFIQTRTRTAFRGRVAPDDEPIGDTLSELFRADAQASELQWEEREVFRDGATTGFGAFKLDVTFDDADQAQIRIRGIDCLELYPDPHSRRYNWQEDARFIHWAKWVPIGEAKARWPKHAKALASMCSGHDALGLSSGVDSLSNRNYFDFDKDGNVTQIRVVEAWWKDYERRTVDGISDVRPIVRCTVFTQDLILEHKANPLRGVNFLPFAPYYVERRKNGCPYSHLRTAKSMQDAVNKRESKAIHLMNTRQALYETNSIADPAVLADELHKPDGQIEVRKIDALKIETNLDLGAAQYNLHQGAKSDFRTITGVNPDALGERSEVRSGVGIARKVAMTDMILTPMYDNFRRTRALVASGWLKLAQAFYREPRVFLVTDDLKQARHHFFGPRELEALQSRVYDVVVDDVPDLATLQQEQMALLMQHLPQWAQLNPGWVRIFVQMSDLRAKDDLLKQIDAMMQPPTPVPNVSLSLKWEELSPAEKAAMAGRIGIQTLAEASAEDPQQTAVSTRMETEITREELRAHVTKQDIDARLRMHREKIAADLAKAQLDAETKLAVAEQQAQVARENAERQERAADADREAAKESNDSGS